MTGMVSIYQLNKLRISQIQAYAAFNCFMVWDTAFDNHITKNQQQLLQHHYSTALAEAETAKEIYQGYLQEQIQEYKEGFAKCFAGIHALRAEEVLAEYNAEKEIEIKILQKITKMPLDMEREIVSYCGEVEYQKKLIKHEYIIDNAQKITNKLFRLDKKKVSKLWCHSYCKEISKNIPTTQAGRDFIAESIEDKKKWCEKKYKKTTKNAMIDDICHNINMFNYYENSYLNVALTKEKFVCVLWDNKKTINTQDIYSIFKAVEMMKL